MKRTFHLLLMLAALTTAFFCAVCCNEPIDNPGGNTGGDEPAPFVPDRGTTVYGVVQCDGKGIEGVAVTDGYEVTVTDKDGMYQF